MDFDADWELLNSVDFDDPNWADNLQFEYDTMPDMDLMGSLDELDGAWPNAESINDQSQARLLRQATDGNTAGEPGLLDRAAGFVANNPKLTELGLKTIGGAYAASKTREASEAARKAAEEEKLRTRQRISDSIVNMKKPEPTGLIPQLTRTTGLNVFRPDGGLA